MISILNPFIVGTPKRGEDGDQSTKPRRPPKESQIIIRKHLIYDLIDILLTYKRLSSLHNPKVMTTSHDGVCNKNTYWKCNVTQVKKD